MGIGCSALKDTGPRFWQITWSRSQCFRLMHKADVANKGRCHQTAATASNHHLTKQTTMCGIVGYIGPKDALNTGATTAPAWQPSIR